MVTKSIRSDKKSYFYGDQSRLKSIVDRVKSKYGDQEEKGKKLNFNKKVTKR